MEDYNDSPKFSHSKSFTMDTKSEGRVHRFIRFLFYNEVVHAGETASRLAFCWKFIHMAVSLIILRENPAPIELKWWIFVDFIRSGFSVVTRGALSILYCWG